MAGLNLYPDSLMQLAQLTASDGVQPDSLGWSVAMSGNTIVLTGLGTSAYVFVKPQTGWANMTQAAELTTSNGATLGGRCVAISGNVIVVGAPLATVGQNSYQGAVYLYVEPDGGWTNMTETAELTASDGLVGGQLGTSVAISGNTAVAGASFASHGGGPAAYVFTRPEGGWTNTTQTAELSPSDGSVLAPSVAIAGKTIVAGWTYRSAAYVFIEPATGWADATENAKLTATYYPNGDDFAWSVATDGTTIIAGAIDMYAHGAAYVFVKPENGWASTTETAELRPANGTVADFFGWAVSVSGDRIVVGAPDATANEALGAAYIYSKPVSGWQSTSRFTEELTAPAGFGSAVAVNGTFLAVGASAFGDNLGTAYVFGP